MAGDTTQNDPNAKKGYATPGRRNKSTAATTTARESKSSGGILSGIFDYFREVRAELGKVVWPTREQTQRLTIIVIVTTVISAIVLGALSLFMSELIRLGLNNPAIFVVLFGVIIAVTIAWSTGRLNKWIDILRAALFGNSKQKA